MKALYFDQILSLRTLPDPEPLEGEALIAVKTVGICNTDLEILKGYMTFKGVPGHEFAGIIAQSDDKHLLNKRVVGEINIGCKQCDLCNMGLQRHCPKRTVLGIQGKDGAMAQYITLPVDNLFILPDSIDYYEAVFIEPLAAACEILEQIHIHPRHNIMVLGDGKLASLIAQTISTVNPNVYVKGLNPDKIQLLQNLNLNAGSEPFNKKKWDIIVEATGNSQGLSLAIEYVKPRGTIILKSTYNEQVTFDHNAIVVNEINILGSRCGNFKLAIELIKKKLLKVRPFISKTIPFSQFKEAFAEAQKPNNYKIILEIDTA